MSLLLRRCGVKQFKQNCNSIVNLNSQKTGLLGHLSALNLNTSRTESTAATSVGTKPKWNQIYRLPLARVAAAFNRLKIYQTVVTVVATPAMYALEQAGQISSHSTLVCAAVGVSGMLTLTIASMAAQNLVGIIYLNETEDKVKLAYVDFWGLRKEAVIETEDLVPIWEHKKPPRFDFYQPILLYSDAKRKFKLLQRFGVVLEPTKFVQLFGE